MKRGVAASAAALFVLLATWGLLGQQPDRKLTPTSYGTSPRGFKGLYDLLRESGVPAERSLARFADLPETTTIWWIEPLSVCERGAPAPAATTDADRVDYPGPTHAPEEREEWSGAGWLLRGGTAVVFLTPADEFAACAGAELPGRAVPETPTPPPGPTPTPTFDLGVVENPAPPQQRVQGPRVPAKRALAPADLEAFTAAGNWNVAAQLDGAPFILERSVGAGRLVVVADDRFLTNAWLDHADAAPLAMDLVRAYGAPALDERDHGFGTAGSTSAYLWRSSARAAFLGLAMLGAVFAWWGAALPPRTADATATSAPTLERYVDSLATLYARARDYGAVAERYREFTLSELRRQTGLPQDTPADTVIERLLRQRRLDENEARLLRQQAAVASAAELRQQTQRLDQILRKAVQS